MSRYKLPFFACPADFKGLFKLSVGLIRLMFYYGPHPYITVKASMYVEGAMLVVHNCMMNNACGWDDVHFL